MSENVEEKCVPDSVTDCWSNEVEVRFKSLAENEGFARMVVSSYIISLNPSIEEMQDLKTAVSEAVTNSVIHAYDDRVGDITMRLSRKDRCVCVDIIDYGVGIDNVELAMEPLFTTKPDKERSGMGFSFMELFTDSLSVNTKRGSGTSVHMEKVIKGDFILN